MSGSKQECPSCYGDITDSNFLSCKECKSSFHFACSSLPAKYVLLYANTKLSFICTKCIPLKVTKISDFSLEESRISKIIQEVNRKVNTLKSNPIASLLSIVPPTSAISSEASVDVDSLRDCELVSKSVNLDSGVSLVVSDSEIPIVGACLSKPKAKAVTVSSVESGQRTKPMLTRPRRSNSLGSLNFNSSASDLLNNIPLSKNPFSVLDSSNITVTRRADPKGAIPKTTSVSVPQLDLGWKEVRPRKGKGNPKQKMTKFFKESGTQTFSSSGSNNKKLPLPPVPPMKSKKSTSSICRFHLQGRCQHGRFGSGCEFSHPPLCRSFIAKGNNGCARADDCSHIHPKLCQSSLKNGVCNRIDCFYYHVKGSTRPRRLSKPPIQVSNSSGPNLAKKTSYSEIVGTKPSFSNLAEIRQVSEQQAQIPFLGQLGELTRLVQTLQCQVSTLLTRQGLF